MRFLPWLLLYSLMVAYGSTVIGPKGINYVPMDPSDALREFTKRAFVWVNNGSDQRADWMGNLAMFVPFGFMMLGSVAPRLNRGIGASIATFVAFLLSVVFLMGVKYAQLFFPPRTVTLNYMVAQASGALIGIVLIQRSEGGGLGIGSSQGMGSLMGGRGTANLLTRTTAILGTLFFALSLSLALMNRGTVGANRSLLETPASSAPVAPLAPAGPSVPTR